jgi:single-strand DNA-binding protein
MINRAVLVGRLTKDPELRFTQNGVALANFTLAVDRARKNANGEKETDFIPIIVWQKMAEYCAEYLHKGSLCAVDGRIQVRTYDDRDGNRRWVTEVVSENIRFLDRKKTESPQNSDAPPQNNNIGTEVNFDPEDVPF